MIAEGVSDEWSARMQHVLIPAFSRREKEQIFG
jgi:hypothetical protein